MHNVIKSFRANKVKRKLEKIIEEYKMVSMEEVRQSPKLEDSSDEASDLESTAVEADEMFNNVTRVEPSRSY